MNQFDTAEITANILTAIKKAKREGLTSMSPDNLRQVAKTPTNGPRGANAPFLYRDAFRAILATIKLPRGFSLLS